MVVTHSLAREDGDRTGMKHAIVFTLINFSMKLQKDEQVRVLSKDKHQNPFSCCYGLVCICPLDRGMSTCTQVIIHSGMLSLIDDRSVLMFKVCRWESPSVSHCREERVGSRVDCLHRDTPTGWDHRLSFHHWSSPNRGGNCAQIWDTAFWKINQQFSRFVPPTVTYFWLALLLFKIMGQKNNHSIQQFLTQK